MQLVKPAHPAPTSSIGDSRAAERIVLIDPADDGDLEKAHRDRVDRLEAEALDPTL